MLLATTAARAAWILLAGALKKLLSFYSCFNTAGAAVGVDLFCAVFIALSYLEVQQNSTTAVQYSTTRHPTIMIWEKNLMNQQERARSYVIISCKSLLHFHPDVLGSFAM